MRIVVTGGAGFIGSNFVRKLLGDQYVDMTGTKSLDVRLLDKLTYAGTMRSLDPVADDPRLTFVRGDVCDAELVAGLVQGAELVVHFAAETHVDRSITGPRDFVLTNVVGSQTVLQAALEAGAGKVVMVSTDEVYGTIACGSCDENHRLAPNSPYSASKAAADLLARSYHRTYGLPVCVTRCSNTYGPYQFPEKLIPLFITNLMDGRRLPVYGDGRNIRDWIHVDDHCRAVALVARHGRPGETYNVGGGNEMSNLDITAELLKIMGAGWRSVEYVTDRAGHDFRYSMSGEKARKEIGFQHSVGFADGLAETVDWYIRNRDWWEPLARPVPSAGTAAR
jgi:dTDP-glucose 4,6-dehydratase